METLMITFIAIGIAGSIFFAGATIYAWRLFH